MARVGPVYHYPGYVGLDQRKSFLVVAVANDGREALEDWGRLENSEKGVRKLLKRLVG